MCIGKSLELGLNELIIEKERFEFEHELLLLEIEEYRCLSERLPDYKDIIYEMSEKSRVRLIGTQAKINALCNVINKIKNLST